MRVLARKTISGFIPADDDARQEFNRVPLGKVAYVEIKTARNPKQHRLLFALLQTMVGNTDHFPSTEVALLELKAMTGLVDTYIINGNTVYAPRSIAFANMPQREFEEWFQVALKYVAEKYLLVSPQTLNLEVQAIANA